MTKRQVEIHDLLIAYQDACIGTLGYAPLPKPGLFIPSENLIGLINAIISTHEQEVSRIYNRFAKVEDGNE